jgi:hypothetical protein
VLLAESKSIGFVGDIKDIVAAADAKHKKPSLLDIADFNGNTPLHWAAAHRNVSMVGMSVLTTALSCSMNWLAFGCRGRTLSLDLTPCCCNSFLFLYSSGCSFMVRP